MGWGLVQHGVPEHDRELDVAQLEAPWLQMVAGFVAGCGGTLTEGLAQVGDPVGQRRFGAKHGAVDRRHPLDLFSDDAFRSLLHRTSVAAHPEGGEALRLEEQGVDQPPLVGHAFEDIARINGAETGDQRDPVQAFGHVEGAGKRVGQPGRDAGD